MDAIFLNLLLARDIPVPELATAETRVIRERDWKVFLVARGRDFGGLYYTVRAREGEPFQFAYSMRGLKRIIRSFA